MPWGYKRGFWGFRYLDSVVKVNGAFDFGCDFDVDRTGVGRGFGRVHGAGLVVPETVVPELAGHEDDHHPNTDENEGLTLLQ